MLWPVGTLWKAHYLAGAQCAKQLYWRVHEPSARELVPDAALSRRLDRGREVGALARRGVSGGVLIQGAPSSLEQRLADTATAMSTDAPALYEATFAADGLAVAIDVLERHPSGWVLVEVKSSTELKEEYLDDVAFQVHVARRAGCNVVRAEVMFLNRECRFPDLSNLFVREDVTKLVEERLAAVASRATVLLGAIQGAEPDVPIGAHCDTPHPCPFKPRCHPPLPRGHVVTLYRGGKKVEELRQSGVELLSAIPDDFELVGPAARQRAAARTNTLVVERELQSALAVLTPPVALLDFETTQLAVPIWPGCRPYEQLPVQFSVHRQEGTDWRHLEWLAPDGGDHRAELAEALLAACQGAATVPAYNSAFEKSVLEALAEAVPSRAAELRALAGRLVDLLPVVRDHVYHPDFDGSFSLKAVLPALVPDFTYEDLAIRSGDAASLQLERVLFSDEPLPEEERRRIRRAVLDYCQRDTLALVRLIEALARLARS